MSHPLSGFVPWWVHAVLFIFILAPIGTGLMGLTLEKVPLPPLGDLVLEGKDKNVRGWAARQLASGCVCVIALLLASKDAYACGFGFHLCRIIFDIIVEFMERKRMLMVGAFCGNGVLCTLAFIWSVK